MDYSAIEDASAAELINGKRVVVGGNQKSGLDIAVEWNYGGFLIWLHFIPGIELRTDNEPFKKLVVLHHCSCFAGAREDEMIRRVANGAIANLAMNDVGADLFWALFSSLFGSGTARKEPREYALSLVVVLDGESKCFKAAL
ncbi:hypothetical protein Syun_025446 [Stephania yunnanensis]|uniref:Uncharacterized protein n=1 Tax=Stephania yunnanensis TaxID=152371 RepID=A0AAP0HVT2_9MAGN